MGVKKWEFLMRFSTTYADIGWWGVRKSPNMCWRNIGMVPSLKFFNQSQQNFAARPFEFGFLTWTLLKNLITILNWTFFFQVTLICMWWEFSENISTPNTKLKFKFSMICVIICSAVVPHPYLWQFILQKIYPKWHRPRLEPAHSILQVI